MHELIVVQVTTNALSMLTRLRQLALHPGLIPADYAEQLLKADEEDDPNKAAQDITPAEKVRLQGLLAQAIEDNEECPVCFDVLDIQTNNGVRKSSPDIRSVGNIAAWA